jgi:oxygen-dependent protoporphyrinogen oxidase
VNSSAVPATVVVIGGGIAGLAAAARLHEERPDVEITVLEASPEIGGKLKLAEIGGVVVDVGAESMLNRRPEGVALARTSGLTAAVVHPATTSAQLWNRGELVPMPKTMMGIPTDLRLLAESGVISKTGMARAAMDAVLPATSLEGRDTSIGGLVEERFGREVVDRLVEPLLGGVYAGHAREISARAAVPQVVALLDRDRSLGKAAARATSGPTGDSPVFAGLAGGMGRLPGAVAETSGATIETDATVRDLARRSGGGWTLVVGSTREPRLLQADAVIVAVPARAAARLLSDVVPGAALELARIEYASVALVTMAFPARDFPATDGSGFLVPPVEKRAIKAATFSFAKWDWVREAGEPGSPNGIVVMRCSLGRHREEHQLQASDEELVEIALNDLADAIGLSVRPIDTHVQRWGGGLPQYAVGHLDRVASIRSEIARVPGLAVCGAAYDGVGIPACIASAHLAVASLLPDLPAPSPRDTA